MSREMGAHTTLKARGDETGRGGKKSCISSTNHDSIITTTYPFINHPEPTRDGKPRAMLPEASSLRNHPSRKRVSDYPFLVLPWLSWPLLAPITTSHSGVSASRFGYGLTRVTNPSASTYTGAFGRGASRVHCLWLLLLFGAWRPAVYDAYLPRFAIGALVGGSVVGCVGLWVTRSSGSRWPGCPSYNLYDVRWDDNSTHAPEKGVGT